MEELRISIFIIINCLNKIPSEEIKTFKNKLLPNRNLIKNTMESTIHHFKIMTIGLILPKNNTYSAIEAPKGEFGIYISSLGGTSPNRVKLRIPGFYHLQGIKYLTHQHFLADVVTVIGTADIVFGEVDR
jgi:NADH:ubiquinone oxidoreductase subunit D